MTITSQNTRIDATLCVDSEFAIKKKSLLVRVLRHSQKIEFHFTPTAGEVVSLRRKETHDQTGVRNGFHAQQWTGK